MSFVELEEIEARELLPGFVVRFVHTERMTFAYWTIAEGAELPEHAHPHEQVANVLEGKLELTVSGETRVLKPGAVGIIPPDALHSGRALTPCEVLDVFHPVREEYR